MEGNTAAVQRGGEGAAEPALVGADEASWGIGAVMDGSLVRELSV